MISPLNSPLEVSVRILLLLADAHPGFYDVDTLATFDHCLVHSGEFGGPESLHVDFNGQVDQLGIKRELVLDGLQLLLRSGLVRVELADSGICFRASEEGPGFARLLVSEYAAALRERVQWLLFRIDQESLPVSSPQAHLIGAVLEWGAARQGMESSGHEN